MVTRDTAAMPLAAFEALVAQLDYPMFIVTVAVPEGHGGCLIGFATQASIDPSRFAACLSHRNQTFRLARRATHLGIHAVPADAGDLAELFGGETGDRVDKLARTPWSAGPHGVPLLERCPNRFVGRILDRVDAGDHDVFLLEPVAAEAADDIASFTFHRARRIEPGHEA
jgi:flavin reductase (DIM6/NTAB) family NADH-FMN oxidoreductase RutF